MSNTEFPGPVSELDDKEKELATLIEMYLRKSEELEAKEAEVLEKVEFMQSAIASIREWNERKSTGATTCWKPVFVDVKEIEEETRHIREETERIQEEVRQKIEDNRRLQEEIDRRKMREGKALDDLIRDDFERWEERRALGEEMGRREIETRCSTSGPSCPVFDEDDDPGIQFFRDKLKKLKMMEIAQRRESKDETERTNQRMKKLKEKIELLEWESEFDKRLLQALKKREAMKRESS